MKMLVTTLAACALLTAHAEPGRSLNQVRSEINNGTWAGTTIYKSKPKAETPEAAASAASGAAASKRSGGLFGLGEPPSGKPMKDATRLDSPTQGIALPTASTADTATKGR